MASPHRWASGQNGRTTDPQGELLSLSALIDQENQGTFGGFRRPLIDKDPDASQHHRTTQGAVVPNYTMQNSPEFRMVDHLLPALLDDKPIRVQDALTAAEHGNSDVLAAYLHSGGDPHVVSQAHHSAWTLLHLAAGCALMGGALNPYRTRPEPECPDGFAASVSLLLAAGADPNSSSQLGFTPLMGACRSGDAECCKLLLQAGADIQATARDGSTPVDAASRSRIADGHMQVLQVLHNPPVVLPRAPLRIGARLLKSSEAAKQRDAEITWEIPKHGTLPTMDIQRYVVRAYIHGQSVGLSQFHTKESSGRRDFCSNGVVDRGIALRRNLGIEQPSMASTVVYGLLPGIRYHFTVSTVVEVDSAMRESPPSLLSKAVDVPFLEEEDWNMGDLLDSVFGAGVPQDTFPLFVDDEEFSCTASAKPAHHTLLPAAAHARATAAAASALPQLASPTTGDPALVANQHRRRQVQPQPQLHPSSALNTRHIPTPAVPYSVDYSASASVSRSLQDSPEQVVAMLPPGNDRLDAARIQHLYANDKATAEAISHDDPRAVHLQADWGAGAGVQQEDPPGCKVS